MAQGPSWEANWFAASQEILRISRNLKFHYRTHKLPPPVSILGQPNPVHILYYYYEGYCVLGCDTSYNFKNLIRFGSMCRLNLHYLFLPWRQRQQIPSKARYICTSRHTTSRFSQQTLSCTVSRITYHIIITQYILIMLRWFPSPSCHYMLLMYPSRCKFSSTASSSCICVKNDCHRVKTQLQLNKYYYYYYTKTKTGILIEWYGNMQNVTLFCSYVFVFVGCGLMRN